MNISVPHGPPMYLRAFKFYLQNGHNSATFAEMNTDAAANNEVKLFYGDTKKFETVSSGVNIVGTTTSTQLAVTGVSTFTGNIDANGDLDVDGHTNLDNVSIAGVTTHDASLKLNTSKRLEFGLSLIHI